MQKFLSSWLVPKSSKVAFFVLSRSNINERLLTGSTGFGLELTRYDRSTFHNGRGLSHALSVRSLLYLPRTAFNDYVFLFGKFRFHSERLDNINTAIRILRVYAYGHKLHLPRQILYSHFGNMDDNPWPFKAEFNDFALIRKLYFAIRLWPEQRISELLGFSQLALAREGHRIDHKIARIRGFSPWNGLSAILSILISYFAIRTAGLNEVEAFLNSIYPIDTKYSDLRNFSFVILLMMILNIIIYFRGLLKINSLESARRKLEMIDFAIRIALSEKRR